jgi:PKHD-type hydroxylase
MIFNIDPKHSFGKSTLAYWENFLTTEELKFIASTSEWNNLHDASIGTGNQGIVNKEIRETGVNFLYPNEQNNHIWEKISQTVSEVNRQFFKFNLTGFYEPMQLGLYHSGNNGHYNWHTDAGMQDKNTPRKLSMVLMLSDPSSFEGGELQVKIDSDTPFSVEQKLGRAWFFPSYVLHRVTPVTKGFRQSAVIWIGGPEFV